MPADPIHPDQLDGGQRFRADSTAYLDSLPISDLAELLSELPSHRQQPIGLGVLMIALNELPDAYKLLPPAGHPGPGEGRRRSLREVVAHRRAARTSRHPDAPASGLAEWLADRQRQADQNAERARAGAVGGRGAARSSDRLRPGGRPPEPGDPPAERERDRQDQERDREPEDEFGDSWRTHRERADHLRQAYGWTVPPPRAEPWLPLGRDDDRKYHGEPDRSRRWLGEERYSDREGR